MSDRLINADRAIEMMIKKECTTCKGGKLCVGCRINVFLEFIKEQPTAYDVNEVKDAIISKIKPLDNMSKYYEEVGCKSESDRMKQIASAFRESLNIVHRGGGTDE